MIKIIGNKKIELSAYGTLFILVTVIVVGIAAAVYLYNLEPHSLYFYGDSTSHSHSARVYVDSNRPGFFEHLGTVWLPLPHLLLLPFTLIDPLFTSGFSGLIVSLPSHAITSLILYKIVRRHVDNPYIPIVGSFLYAFNPNFLYLSFTSLTEAPFMLFFVASAYYFQKWIFGSKTNNNIQSSNSFLVISTPLNSLNLIKSAVFVSLATLCRYEGWPIAISLVIMVIATFLIKKTVSHYIISRRTVLIIVIFSIISFSGMTFWMIWNAYRYGDPLEFSNNPIYSASGQALLGKNREFLYLQPLNVLKVYGTVLLYTFGPAILVAALMGYIVSTLFSKDNEKSRRVLLYLFLVVPAIFTLTSLIGGVGEMNLAYWFNARFIILSAPLLVILNCMFVAYIYEKIKMLRIKRNGIIIVSTIILSLFVYQTISPFFIVVTFADAIKQFDQENRLAQLGIGNFLHRIYNGSGPIFLITTGGQESNIALESGFPLKSFRVIRDSDSNSLAFLKPWLSTNYLVLSKEPKDENKYVSNYWISRQGILSDFYNKVYENKYYTIFSIKHGDTSGCINYDSSTHTISITCKAANLTDVYNRLNDSNLLHKESTKVWFLNANLTIENDSTLYINSSDTDWLKLNSTAGVPHNIKAHGDLIIDSVKITGWDSKASDYARTDTNGTIPRSYIVVEDGKGTTNITNSEIAYLGYEEGNSKGITYYSGEGSTLFNNTIHDLWTGFHAYGPYKITIVDNGFYNNRIHGIDIYGHDLTIKNNTVYNNDKKGIFSYGGSSNIIIESNKIFNNTQEGIMLYKNVSDSSIRNNTVSNNADEIAIYEDSNNNTIYNNSMKGGKVGIRVTANSSHNLIFNNSMMNSNYGIYVVEGASNNVIDSNRIVNTSDTAILIEDPETNNNIFKNNILLDSQRNEINRNKLGTSGASFINNTIESSR